MKAVFVTGTDTGIGKTIVTGLLGRYLLCSGRNVITQKWIETESRGFSKDVSLHLKLMGKKREDVKGYTPHLSPYTFEFASSPHLAADLEKREIDDAKIKESFEFLKKEFDFVIVEGIGGALVPYNKKRLVIDIAKDLKLPVLVVAGNRLGAINHTLLTIEAIKKRGMDILGIIFNNLDVSANRKIIHDNIDIVKRFTGIKTMSVLPYMPNSFTAAAQSEIFGQMCARICGEKIAKRLSYDAMLCRQFTSRKP
jgi:dethiobiotin synthetase